MSWVIENKVSRTGGASRIFTASCSDCGVSSHFYLEDSARKAGEQHKEICVFIMEAKNKAMAIT